jgi:hypothetical protein
VTGLSEVTTSPVYAGMVAALAMAAGLVTMAREGHRGGNPGRGIFLLITGFFASLGPATAAEINGTEVLTPAAAGALTGTAAGVVAALATVVVLVRRWSRYDDAQY